MQSLCYAIWVRNVLTDLAQSQKSPTVVYPYNLEAISWTKEVQELENVKHTENKFHYAREKLFVKSIAIQ